MFSHLLHRSFLIHGLLLSGLLLTMSCARAGSSGSSDISSSAGDDHASITGMITDASGSAAQMKGWAVVMVERKTGICRVGIVDQSGNYQLSGVALNRIQTIILLGPQFHLESVLSIPSSTAKAINQYFTLNIPVIPPLIHTGAIVTFSDTSSLTIDTADIAADSNENGIPDGMDGTLLLAGPGGTLNLTSSSVDTDKDGIPNASDPDIDGDGIINWFDPDIDGDGVVNIFDVDANGDGISDINKPDYYGSQYFSEGMDYAAVQVVQQTNVDSSLATSLVFLSKVKTGVSPAAVAVRAPSTITTGATVPVTDATTGVVSSTAWDGTLAAATTSTAASATSGTVYGRTVNLATGQVLQPDQCIFIQLLSKVATETVYTEFPYCFAAILTGALTATWDKSTSTVTMAGTPFTDYVSYTVISSFTWSLYLIDSTTNETIFSSDPIDGATTYYQIPTGRLQSGVTYNAYIAAMSIGKVAGVPLWVLKSPTFTVSE